MKSWLSTVGSNASYKSVASSIGQAVNTGAAAVKAAVKEDRAATQPADRHHVRLSLESAKRLRWIESEDVSALVRRHSQEKNLMGECVSAMRKFLLQKGFEEDEMDAEVQALLNEAREIDINDQDVATVLLVSVQDEVTELRSRLAAYESQHGDPTTSTNSHGPVQTYSALPVSSNASDRMHLQEHGATSRNTSYTRLLLPPGPPDASPASQGNAAAGMHGVVSPRLSRADSISNSNPPAVQLLFTVETDHLTGSPMHGAHASRETVRCTIVPVAKKTPEPSVARAQSAPEDAYNSILWQAAHLQDLLAQQNSIYSELLSLKPAIMSAQIAATSGAAAPAATGESAHAGGGTAATPFTSSGSPAAADTFKTPTEAPETAGGGKLFGSGTLSPLTLSFQTGTPEIAPQGSPVKMHAPHASALSPGKPGAEGPGASPCSPTQGGQVPAASVPGGASSGALPGGQQGGVPPRLELSHATSLDSAGSAELRFGSPRSCAQATADLQPMLARLGELERQRRTCLEATTDATAALLAAASIAAAAPVATPGTTRVRELENQVAQLRSALRRATAPDAGSDTAGVGSPGVGSPSKGGSRGLGDEKGGGQKSQAAAAQVQLRMARQLVLSEQDRASHAEKRAELLEARCKKLKSEAHAAAAKAKAAEARATGAGAAAAAREAAAEREAELAAQRAALRNAQRDAANATVSSEAAEKREAAALAQVASLETIVEEKGRLEARVAALQGRVDDSAAERKRADHFREMSEALEAKIEAHMHENVEAAKAVADADARAASMHDAMMGALREQQAAEARAALLETKVRDEVAARIRAIGTDQSLWPQEAQEALNSAQSDATAAQARVKTLERDMHAFGSRQTTFPAARQQSSEEIQGAAVSEMHVEAVRAESSRAQARFEKQMQRLEKELSSCQDAKRRLEAEIAMSMHGSHASRTHSGGAARNGSSGVPGAIISSASGMNRPNSAAFWGQGILPGLPGSPDAHTPLRSPHFGDTNPSASANVNGLGAIAAPSATADVSISLDDVKRASKYEGVPRGGAGGFGADGAAAMDVPYLRNLLMRLLQSIAAGKASERDALLPIVGMLVGASPGECDSLKQLFVSNLLW